MNLNKPLYWIGGRFVKIYTAIMLRMSVVTHHVIPSGAKIIVANHPTTSDPFILTSISNGQAAVLIKNVLFDVPIFGKYLHWAGHIPVQIENGKEAFDRALKLLNRGVTVIVFIEGDLSKYLHKINKPKTGAVRLAILSGKPIIPIGIGVKSKNIKSIKSIINGVHELGKWYLKGPYALTIGNALRFKGSIHNKNRIRILSNWLAKNISALQKESYSRI